MVILVTGTAGFIGYHLVNRLLSEGHEVIGLDNLNTYYDINLKQKRLLSAGIDPAELLYAKNLKSKKYPGYTFAQLNLEDKSGLQNLFNTYKPQIVINLAAQAGVRYSLENPGAYVDSNIVGFVNILEACRHGGIEHLVYASSSSVYGLNADPIFSTSHGVNHPISLYAATKRSNELMAHTYSHLFSLPVTGLRFFTVYGPWGRPDMALFLFTKAILNNKPIEVYNSGEMYRDFTYIDDIIDGIMRVTFKYPSINPNWDGSDRNPAFSSAPFRLYNIGNSQPVKLTDFIEAIEDAIGIPAVKVMLPLQPGDVVTTYANVDDLKDEHGYKPKVNVREGVKNFVEWYRQFYNV